MKKITALFLILILLFSALCVSANAVSQDKITDDLKDVLSMIDDESTVDVRVSFDYTFGGLAAIMSSYDYADKTTGIDRNNFKSNDERVEYYRVFKIKLDDIMRTQAQSLMEKLDLSFEDVAPYQKCYQEDLGSCGVPTQYSLTKERIESLSDADEVVSIDLDDKNLYPIPYALIHPYSDDPQEKMNAELKELLPTLSESDEVYVWIYADPEYMTSAELDEKTNEICGKIECGATMGEADRWRRTRNELMQQDRVEKIAALMEELSLTEDNVFVRWETEFDHSGWPSGFILSKAKIIEIVNHNQIKGIELYIGRDILGEFAVENTEGKITDRLRAKFNVVSDTQKMEIWMSSGISYSNAVINQMKEEASRQCGFTLNQAKNIIQIMRWYSAYNTLFYTNRHNKVTELAEKLGISEDDFLEEWDPDDIKCKIPAKLLLTKSQIEQIAADAMEIDEVYYLDLYVGQDIHAPEPEDDPEEELRNEFTGSAYYKGDADDDYVITVIDATLIQKKLASIVDDPDGVIVRNGDVTGDGLDIIDATQIQKKLAGFENKFDVGAEMIIP